MISTYKKLNEEIANILRIARDENDPEDYPILYAAQLIKEQAFKIRRLEKMMDLASERFAKNCDTAFYLRTDGGSKTCGMDCTCRDCFRTQMEKAVSCEQ